MIQALAIITTQPGKRADVLAAFNENRTAVLAEAGCIEYGAVVDADNLPSGWTSFGPDVFVVVEKWESVDALKAHVKAPHMATYGAKIKDWVANRVIHVLEPVGG